MPHVNLLYPFVPLAEFTEAARKLSVALAPIEPFEVTFDAVRHFTHGKGTTIWLSPAPFDKVKAVQSALESAFPFCKDLSTKSDAGFVPHLSLGQWPSRDAESQCAALSSSTLPKLSAFLCSSVELIARENDEPFAIRYSIPFGGKAVIESRVPYLAEPVATSSSSSAAARPRAPRQNMTLKLFVSGLRAQVSEQDVREMFVRNGFTVRSAKLILGEGGLSRGFAFVTLDSDDSMRRAVDSAKLFEPHAQVAFARPK